MSGAVVEVARKGTSGWEFPADVPGWLTEAEGRALAGLAAGRKVLEIGSYCGRSTICMAQTAKHVDAVDWGKGDERCGAMVTTGALGENLERYGVNGRVTLWALRIEELAPELQDGSFDLVFVDGAHDEPSVRHDIALAKRVVKHGGVIALHDSGEPTVRAAARAILGWEVGGMMGLDHGTTVEGLHYRTWEPKDQTLFVALPRRPGRKVPGEEGGAIKLIKPANRGKFKAGRVQSSLLCYTFNKLWAAARNCQEDVGLTDWAMQHDDIVPTPGYADVLIDERVRCGATIMSAVVPIKDNRGLTSTGIRNSISGNTRRLTMTEIFKLPETFGLEDIYAAGLAEPQEGDLLAVNTGLWVCSLLDSWVDHFPGFCMADAVRKDESGKWYAGVVPEDWACSEWLAKRGLKAMATRKVALAHVDDDGKEYRNDHVWGDWETDLGDGASV